MSKLRSDTYMQTMLDDLGISYELTDVWNDNIEEVENKEHVTSLIEQYGSDPWLKEEMYEELKDWSSEGMARTFGEYVDIIDTESAVKFARESLDDEKQADNWSRKEDYELYARIEIGGDIIYVYEDEEDALRDFIEEQLDSDAASELAVLFSQ